MYDADVFEYSAKPPVNWNKLEKSLKELGAFEVNHIKVKQMLEDWLLIDKEGICSYLKIKVPKDLKGRTGYEKIKKLFKTADKVYQKGS